MKNTIIRILFALLIMGGIIRCHDHDDFLSPRHEEIWVGFDSTQVMVLENEEQKIIRLSFSGKSMKRGVLSLSISDATPSKFTMEPAISNGRINLTVEPNQESAIIKIKPVDNSLTDGNLEFTISISSVTEGFEIGEKRGLSIEIQDDDIIIPPQEVVANFIMSDRTVAENNVDGKMYSVNLSERLSTSGSIEISIAATKAIYGVHFNTIPGANNGKIILHPSIGESQTSLTIMPVDNPIISGELEIAFTITGTSGSITMGSELSQTIIIKDDELANKPKGYESNGGGWGLKKTYEYDEVGRVKYVNIEKSTPATSHYKETFIYDVNNRIERINTYPHIDLVFSWSYDRIIKSESIDNGVVKEYTDYEYDPQGNVSGAANYFRQPDGQFKLGFLNLYLYFQDGNLYKSQTYIPAQGSQELLLISTRTYTQYIDSMNPFPMVEILPTVTTQTKLPTVYTVEENGMTLNYGLAYEFREDGLVSNRMVTKANHSETTQYLYY